MLILFGKIKAYSDILVSFSVQLIVLKLLSVTSSPLKIDIVGEDEHELTIIEVAIEVPTNRPKQRKYNYILRLAIFIINYFGTTLCIHFDHHKQNL